MKWATLDPDGRPSGFYHPDVHPELFEQVGDELRPRSPIANAVPVTEADWQELLSHPGRRKLQGGRVVAAERPALPPDAQAAADRALLREAMLRDQLDAWIEQRATAPAGLSPTELAALQRLRAVGSR
jgi:hypothetical protein